MTNSCAEDKGERNKRARVVHEQEPAADARYLLVKMMKTIDLNQG
jgi:hypothetical protein